MTVIVDTGVLVALIDPDTEDHAWAREEAARLPVPFLTSEAVLTEAAFLLARDGFDADELFEMAESGLILCTDKNDAVVRYTLGPGRKNILASRYKLHLPSEAELRAEIRRELKQLRARA